MRKLSIYGTLGQNDDEQLIAELNLHESLGTSEDARRKMAEAFKIVGASVTSIRKCEVLEYELM